MHRRAKLCTCAATYWYLTCHCAETQTNMYLCISPLSVLCVSKRSVNQPQTWKAQACAGWWVVHGDCTFKLAHLWPLCVCVCMCVKSLPINTGHTRALRSSSLRLETKQCKWDAVCNKHTPCLILEEWSSVRNDSSYLVWILYIYGK